MIGKKLKDLIGTKGIKQVEFAKAIGISPSRLTNYLSDKREPDLALLTRMAAFLGVDMNYFANMKAMAYVVMEEIIHTDRSDTVDIPVKRLNAKKYSEPSDFIKIDRKLMGGDVSDILAVEIPRDIIKPLLLKGDYLLVRHISKHALKHGDFILLTGRDYKAYRVWMYNDEAFITDFDEKGIQKLSDIKDCTVYVVLLFMRVKK